jgi:hypothetical protein
MPNAEMENAVPYATCPGPIGQWLGLVTYTVLSWRPAKLSVKTELKRSHPSRARRWFFDNGVHTRILTPL